MINPETKEVDRTVAPPLHPNEKILLPNVERLHLANGTPVFFINSGSQEVLKLEMIFEAGRWHELQRGVAATTSKMLLEGTSSKSAHQIAEAIDFYGATLGADAAVDFSIINLFSLNKHASRLFPLLHEIIYDSVFPEQELITHIQNNKQRLQVNLQKVDFIAQKTLGEKIYGSQHPTGYTTSLDDYDILNRNMLQAFHQSHFHSGALKILLSGKITDYIIQLLDSNFGSDPAKSSNSREVIHETQISSEKKTFVERKNVVQSGIRIGKPIINKLHTDYPALKILNTVLGGYFGSRLMSNLREEKGYCYGIHSGIASYLHNAHFYIATEVGANVTGEALNEIYKEVMLLQKKLIPEAELRLVRNYLLGVYLSDVDGPFNAAEIVRGLILYGLDESFFYHLIDAIKTVDSETLLALARKYLNPETMLEITVGKHGK